MIGGNVTEKITPETYEEMNREFEKKGSPSELLFLHKKKLMSGKKVTELNIANNLVDKIAELLDAEVHHSLLVDYKGNAQRKISIVYKEEK